MIVEVIDFFPEELRTKKDQETYQAKGTCAVLLSVNGLSRSLKSGLILIKLIGRRMFSTR